MTRRDPSAITALGAGERAAPAGRSDGLVCVYNFFNRTRRPKEAPYSVRVADCRDFQGGR